MFVPLTSDASLKHWPIATACLIALNIAIMIVQQSTTWPMVNSEIGQAATEIATQSATPNAPGWNGLMLSHGDGLHPSQWLTSMLIHAGWVHLLGNMIFLWVFGHVVEGIVGSFAFAGLYLGLGIIQNCVGQLMFLGFSAPPSLGASGAIYSIMMLAALWAPQDNIQCLVLVTFRPLLVSIPTLIMAVAYVLWDLGFALLQHFSLSTEFLHLTGAAVGLVAGVSLLALGRVDGDDRDLLSMVRDATGSSSPTAPKRQQAAPSRETTAAELQLNKQKLVFAWKTFDAHLASDHLESAIAQLQIVRKLDAAWSWEEGRLLNLIQSLQMQRRIDETLHYSEIYLGLFSERAPVVRLVMARMFVQKGLPRKALAALSKIDINRLEPTHRQVASDLASRCQTMIDDGSIETQID